MIRSSQTLNSHKNKLAKNYDVEITQTNMTHVQKMTLYNLANLLKLSEEMVDSLE